MKEKKLKKEGNVVAIGTRISAELYEKIKEQKINASEVCRRALIYATESNIKSLELDTNEILQEILIKLNTIEKKQELLENVMTEKVEYLTTLMGAVKEDIYSVYENIKEILEKQDKPVFLKKENKKEYNQGANNREELKRRLLELRTRLCSSSEDIEKFNLLYSALKNTAETSKNNKDKVARMYQSDLKLAINEIIELSNLTIYDAMIRGWELMKEREE